MNVKRHKSDQTCHLWRRPWIDKCFLGWRRHLNQRFETLSNELFHLFDHSASDITEWLFQQSNYNRNKHNFTHTRLTHIIVNKIRFSIFFFCLLTNSAARLVLAKCSIEKSPPKEQCRARSFAISGRKSKDPNRLFLFQSSNCTSRRQNARRVDPSRWTSRLK